jgi:hypothetical protein
MTLSMSPSLEVGGERRQKTLYVAIMKASKSFGEENLQTPP